MNPQNTLDSIYESLKQATSKADLNIALNQTLSLLEASNQNIKSQELFELFRDKAYELVLAKGDILERAYICLYGLESSEDKEDKKDTRLDSFISIADNNLFLEGMGEEENIMLLELGSIARILSGQKEAAIKYLIKNICLIDMNTPSAEKFAGFILKAFEFLKIPFEVFLEALSEVLEIDFILGLTPKRRRSVFNWQLQVFWNIKHFFNHRDWIKLYPLWEKIFYQMLDGMNAKKIEEALYLHFFIYHMCGNSFTSKDQWLDFNTKISQKASKAYRKFAQIFALPQITPKQKPKKIIGFLRDRLVENSPYKVEYSFLKNLVQNQEFLKHYEIRIYLMGILEKSDDDEFIKSTYEALGIKIIDVISRFNQEGYYNSHLSKAIQIREKIINDGVDILISPNNGYGISDFILSTRSAPKQIFWSHGNFVYDLEEIDTKITHICPQSGALKLEGYDFMGISVPMEKHFYNPPIEKSLIDAERAKYPENKIILGVIGRLTKIDSLPYLENVIEIMKKFQDTIFLACGSGNIYEIQQKINSICPDMLQHFFFPGYISSAIYGHIIDFWLDSFPMEQGESKVEFNAKGGIILTLSKESQEQRDQRVGLWIQSHLADLQKECQKEGISLEDLKEIWLDTSCIAFCVDEYIPKASKLLSLSQSQKQDLSNKRVLLRKIYDNVRKRQAAQSFLKVIENA